MDSLGLVVEAVKRRDWQAVSGLRSAEVAEQVVCDPVGFLKNTCEPTAGQEQQQLVGMGFSPQQAKQALAVAGGNLQAALDQLLMSSS
ncbi:hypothetical protein BASA81_001195 [Batrachochytrium salamandrivorans]|nr:hypothetical protein BASA81_001195 [Batrachochytrium salamandrivorans]